jgi:serine protease inhibitor
MKWRKAFADTYFELQMPRFEMEYPCDLRDALIAVGMESAFDPQAADFGRTTTNQERMWIDKAFQKSSVELDEQGTRAISVPGFMQARESTARPRLKIIVDRPFLFAIVHEPTGIVLFLGIVREP